MPKYTADVWHDFTQRVTVEIEAADEDGAFDKVSDLMQLPNFPCNITVVSRGGLEEVGDWSEPENIIEVS